MIVPVGLQMRHPLPGGAGSLLASKVGSFLASAEATSYYAAAAFRAYSGTGSKLLLQVHPSPTYLRRLYLRAREGGGMYEGLSGETEMAVSDTEIDRWEDEARLASGIIVASKFTKSTLIATGSTHAPIAVVPYGVNLSALVPVPKRQPRRPTVLFVGSKVARKGLHILLEAWRQLAPLNADLRVAGAGTPDKRILTTYRGGFTLLSRLSRPELISEFQQADLFVLPSLAEGFGHVYLEALACGTPIVGTQNTGAPDLVAEGPCGFIVKPADVRGLADCLEFALSHTRQLSEMRHEARRVAELHPWERFREELYHTAVLLSRGQK